MNETNEREEILKAMNKMKDFASGENGMRLRDIACMNFIYVH